LRGTGLGLTSAYAIVKQHGGHLTIKSDPGDGTTVELFLPVWPANATDGTGID